MQLRCDQYYFVKKVKDYLCKKTLLVLYLKSNAYLIQIKEFSGLLLNKIYIYISNDVMKLSSVRGNVLQKTYNVID